MENMKILIVDDKIENLIALETVLEDLEDIEFVRALSGMEALEQLLKHEFALILIDVQMPEMDGFETIEMMKRTKRGRYIPVIFISAIYKEDFYKIQGVKSGGVDFITKPIIDDILIGKVKIFIELYKQKKELEHLVKELQDSLEKVKQLQGLVPICSNCKKIRNDEGYWGTVEQYISDHSDVVFSHTVCDDCMKKLYPDSYKRILTRRKKKK
jgi:CheY-like chemotaxis protein